MLDVEYTTVNTVPRQRNKYNKVIGMASQVYEFDVEMTCEGCSNAVTNVLNKKEGVNNVEIDLQGKKVFVTSSLPSDEIMQVIKKTGKTCQFSGIKK